MTRGQGVRRSRRRRPVPALRWHRLRLEALERRDLLAGIPQGVLRGVTFVDADRDGQPQPHEQVAGVDLSLFRDDGDHEWDPTRDTRVASTRSRDSGAYAFEQLPAGTYFVQQPAQIVRGLERPEIVSGALTIEELSGIIVDAFETPSGPVDLLGPAPAAVEQVFLASDALGGQRDLALHLVSGDDHASISIAAIDRRLQLVTPAVSSGQGTVIWDGLDQAGSGLNPTGLGSLDFTEVRGVSGRGVGICLRGLRFGTAQELTLRVYSDADRWSEVTLSAFDHATTELLDLFLAFPGRAGDGVFVPAGPAGGADLTDIGAVALHFRAPAAPDPSSVPFEVDDIFVVGSDVKVFSVAIEPLASISVEKRTDGFSADHPADDDVPRLVLGETVTWTYDVTNVGDVPLRELTVLDDPLGPITQRIDAAAPSSLLAPGETWIFQAQGEVISGLYGNAVTVNAQSVLPDLDVPPASDTSHYWGVQPDLHVTKSVVSDDGAAGDQDGVPRFEEGSSLRWHFELRNTGAADLRDVVVMDDTLGAITDRIRQEGGDLDEVLEPGEVWFYQATGQAELGRHTNVALVTVRAGHATRIERQDSSQYDGFDPFVVVHTADQGPGSLRYAITAANARPGPQTIAFALPETDAGFVDVDAGLAGGDAEPDVFVIRPAAPLPPIEDTTGATRIDGSSQALFGGDTNPWGPEIVIDGSDVPGDGFVFTGKGHQLRSLVIHSFGGAGVRLGAVGLAGEVAAEGITVAGSFIGTDPTGRVARPNVAEGILLLAGRQHIIGGTDAADLNLISGNGGSGIFVGPGWSGPDAVGHTLNQNIIGWNRDRSAPLGNQGDGITLGGAAHGTVIGGGGPQTANTVAHNLGHGIRVDGAALPAQPQVRWLDLSAWNESLIRQASGQTFSGLVDGSDLQVQEMAATFQIAHVHDAALDRIMVGPNDGGSLQLQFQLSQPRELFLELQSLEAVEELSIETSSGQVAYEHWQGAYPELDEDLQLSGGGSGLGPLGAARGLLRLGLVSSFTWTYSVNAQCKSESFRLGTLADTVLLSSAATGSQIVGNEIVSNRLSGAAIIGSRDTQHAIRRNSIDANGGLGIDLGGDGVTINDPHDPDEGPNAVTNFPTLLAVSLGSTTRVVGHLEARAGTTYDLEFFAVDPPDASEFGEGRRYLGMATLVTDGLGQANFDVQLAGSSQPGDRITSTATVAGGSAAAGSTSEFSRAVGLQAAAITVRKLTNGQEVTNPPGPTLVVGETVTFDYSVSNTADMSLSVVELRDDRGTPADLTDDLLPAPRQDATGANVGDGNRNGRLDSGETWQFFAQHSVVAGPYANLVRVRAEDPLGQVWEATDTSFHLGQGPAGGRLRGQLFEDRNGNGVRDGGEPGVAGAELFLDQNGNGRRDAGEVVSVADESGRYEFLDLAPGRYTVALDRAGGIAQTSPAGDHAQHRAPAPAALRAMTAADLDNDGDLDLVVASDINKSLWVLVNDGHGEFTSGASISLPGRPQFVLADDFSGDGRVDLVVGWLSTPPQTGGSELLYLRGTSSGGFQEWQRLALGQGTASAVLADFDRDGRTDVAVAVHQAGEVAHRAGAGRVVVLRNESGRWVEGQRLATGNQPLALVAGDIDGDGDTDLAVAHYQDDTVTILVNQGGGSFGMGATIPVGRGPSAVGWLEAAGAGESQLVVGHFGRTDGQGVFQAQDSISLFAMAADGGFSKKQEIALPAGARVTQVAVADWDRDGRQDLLAAYSGRDAIAWLRNDMGQLRRTEEYSAPHSPQALMVGQLNQDGNLDLVATSLMGGATVWLHQGGVYVRELVAGQVVEGLDFGLQFDAPRLETVMASTAPGPGGRAASGMAAASAVPAGRNDAGAGAETVVAAGEWGDVDSARGVGTERLSRRAADVPAGDAATPQSGTSSNPVARPWDFVWTGPWESDEDER